MEFKIGDRVKLVRLDDEEDFYKEVLNKVGTVTNINSYYSSVYVDFDNNDYTGFQPYKKNLELVNEDKQKEVPFTKSDLRDTDIITTRNKEMFLGIDFTGGNDLRDDLTDIDDRLFDIIRVERPTALGIVFEREDKEDTTKQVQSLLDNMDSNVLFLNKPDKQAIQELINYVKGE